MTAKSMRVSQDKGDDKNPDNNSNSKPWFTDHHSFGVVFDDDLMYMIIE